MAAKQWRTDEIEPTYTTGQVFGWRLGGTIELETELPDPIAAWTLFFWQTSTMRRALLGTFHLYPTGHYPVFRVFKLSEPNGRGVTTATQINDAATRRYLSWSEHPQNPKGAGVSPVLTALAEAAVERSKALVEKDKRRRAADPLIDVLDQIMLLISEKQVDRARQYIQTQSREDLVRLLVRLALHHNETVDELLDKQEAGEDGL